MQMLERVQKAVAVYQEQLEVEAKERQTRAVRELEERKRLEFEYASPSCFLLPPSRFLLFSLSPLLPHFIFGRLLTPVNRLSQKRDEFERELLARQHQLQEELMLRERARELDKAKFRAEVNAKYEQRLSSLHEFQATLQQQFADYETALRNRYEKVTKIREEMKKRSRSIILVGNLIVLFCFVLFCFFIFCFFVAGGDTQHSLTPTAEGWYEDLRGPTASPIRSVDPRTPRPS